MTNARKLNQRIADAERDLRAAEEWAARLRKAEKAMYASDSDRDQHFAVHLRDGANGALITAHDSEAASLLRGWDGQGYETLDREVQALQVTVEALQERLPSDADVKEAQGRVKDLTATVEAANNDLESLWPSLTDAAVKLADLAQQIIGHRATAAAAAGEVKGEVERYDLDAIAPGIHHPDLEALNRVRRVLNLVEVAVQGGTGLSQPLYAELVDSGVEVADVLKPDAPRFPTPKPLDVPAENIRTGAASNQGTNLGGRMGPPPGAAA